MFWLMKWSLPQSVRADQCCQKGENGLDPIVLSLPRRVTVPFRIRVKHAAAERETTDSICMQARRGQHAGIGEGCPRDYVTGETSADAVEWLSEIRPEIEADVSSFDALQAWVVKHVADIDRHPAAWCAAETACLDLFAREAAVTVETLLGIPDEPTAFKYSAVMGDEDGDMLKALAGRFLQAGLRDFKMRPTGDPTVDRARMTTLRQMAAAAGSSTMQIRLDGNNLWAGRVDVCMAYLDALGQPLRALEEPLAPRDFDGLSRITSRFDLPIILDESLSRADDASQARDLSGQWIANIKLSKAGGLLRCLDLVAQVKDAGWPIIVGAHVGETSVLTRAALIVARAAGGQLMAQEGALGTHLLEHDIVEPVLMFAAGGVLEWPVPGLGNGLGLTPVRDPSGCRTVDTGGGVGSE